jgi:hypothetical protein
LENTHGGVYSALAESLQRPLALLLFAEMGLDGLEAEGITLNITTGMDALSRGNENDKINYWLSDLNNAAQLPQEAAGRMQWEDFMKVTAAGRDVDFTKFIMSETDYQVKMQAAADLDANTQAQARGLDQRQSPGQGLGGQMGQTF